MLHIVEQLEHKLGPGKGQIVLRSYPCQTVVLTSIFHTKDTSTLGMRFGLHSGPVTAGVLRGERARFQLFGDTVNTGKLR